MQSQVWVNFQILHVLSFIVHQKTKLKKAKNKVTKESPVMKNHIWTYLLQVTYVFGPTTNDDFIFIQCFFYPIIQLFNKRSC